MRATPRACLRPDIIMFTNTEEIIQEIGAGRMVIIVDDEDRENEGDLVMAASKVTAPDINYMSLHGRGLICLTVTPEHCKQLRLPLMVADTNVQRSTNFTVSVEAAEGVTTGISAHDRARTIRAASAPGARPEDLRQPGHVFPVMAQPGGVLSRAGHTEAGCDLSRLAGLPASAAIVEILNEDGSMARRPQLEKFAAERGLKIGSIADLIRYRLAKDKFVERLDEREARTRFGPCRLIAYEDQVARTVHLAFVHGDLHKADAPLVRVHVHNTLRDAAGVQADLGWPFDSALGQIYGSTAGVAVLLCYEESPRSLITAMSSLNGQAKSSGEVAPDLRNIGVGAQILRDLGVTRMRVLGAPRNIHALSGFGLEVVEFVGPGS